MSVGRSAVIKGQCLILIGKENSDTVSCVLTLKMEPRYVLVSAFNTPERHVVLSEACRPAFLGLFIDATDLSSVVSKLYIMAPPQLSKHFTVAPS
jgi:hypothetical protein